MRRDLIVYAIGALLGIVCALVAVQRKMRAVVQPAYPDPPEPVRRPTFPAENVRLRAGVRQSAYLPATATAGSGAAWDHTWRFSRPDRGAFYFTTTFDHGLLVTLGRAMSDTGGGYAIHIRSPDHDDPNRFNYGISDLNNINSVQTFASEHGPFRQVPQTYWVRYAPGGKFELGRGRRFGANVIFAVDFPFKTHLFNLPGPDVRFFGFGTSSASAGRTVDGVAVVDRP